MKKVFKVTGIVVLIIIAILFAVPILFKGKIVSIIKSEINKNINAKVEFSDVSISLLRRFPRVSAAVEDLSIAGNGRFSEDTLLSASGIDIALDLMSVIKGDKMTVYSVAIDRPRIHAIVTKDGHANWDIMKPDTSAAAPSESKPFNLELKKYSISDGYVSYVDSSSAMSSVISGLDHEGSGDFTADSFILSTKTSAKDVTFVYGLIPYLNNAGASIDADIQVDNKTSKYSFTTDKILVNDLQLAAKGFFQLLNDSTYNMDIAFNAPSTDFRNILSLVPVVYQKDFSKIKTSGKAVFNGFVRGKYSDTRMPAYNINLNVADGFFQYPDLPAPVKNINVAMKVNNPDGVTDHTVVDISKAHFEMENDPFDLRLLVKSPVSNMWIDATAKGKLNLGNIGRMVKLEDGTSLRGVLDANVSVNGFVDAMQKQQLDKFTAAGTIALNGFSYLSKSYPDGVSLDKMLLTFNPQNVTLNEAAGKYLSTNFQANGQINNLLGYALKNRPLNGSVNVKADRIDVNKFMGTDTASQKDTSSLTPFIVPANLDLVLNAQAGEVKYDNLLIRNVIGALHIGDETIKLDNVRGDALDGTLAVSGSYSTRVNKKHPAIALKYDVQNLDVQKTFNTFNTVQKLMPIGKFLGGKITSSLNLTGNLGQNMLPDLTTLTGKGSLFLIEGLLQKFKPLDQLADKINVSQLKNISLKEIREEFEFNAGKVFVKPFKVKVQDIEMEIGGMHGFDQSLDYTIQIKLPRALLGKGNDAINSLASQAAARGVPIKLNDVVNLDVKMLGTITHPDIRLDLRQTATSVADEIKDQAKDFVKARIDSTTRAVNDTLQSLKSAAVKEAGDRLRQELFGRKDSAAQDTSKNRSSNPSGRLKESGRGLIENINPFKKKK